MKVARPWLVGTAVLLASFGGGCSRTVKSGDIVTLDRAFQSGVLNKGEYEAKKAALEAQGPALAALDKALAAGILTQDEYQTKKARLIANDSALAALEDARRGGVLTQDEYLAKKAALTPAGAMLPSPQAAASIAPTPLPADSHRQTPLKPVPVEVSQAPAPAVPDSALLKPAQAANPTAPPAGAAPSHVLRLKMIRAIDQAGFERPMTSATMLVPTDWQSQGATTWNIKDTCNSIQTTLRASGPDGRAIEIYPAYNWSWADDPKPLQMANAQKAQYGNRPCDVMPPMAAADYLRRNLRRFRPNAQLTGIEPAPKLMDALQRQARQTELSARQYNLQQRVRPDVVRGRLRYTSNGQPVEEWLYVVTITTGTLGPSYNARTNQMTQAYTYACTAYATIERAPQGHLDASEKFFELIAGTYRVSPEWQARLNGHAQALQQTELKGIRDRSAIVSKNADDIAKIQRQGYENAQRSADRRSEQQSQTMRGVETYRNPSTGETVDLSNQYGQAWVNNRGEYLLSDQPGFNPSVTFKEDWKPLERVNK